LSETKQKDNQNRKPLQVLRGMVGKQVLVKLKSDLGYTGQLEKMDVQMNLILTSSVEYDGNKEVSNLGRVIIRGNNILYVSLAPATED
jgi:small nuclear ribonucleoprotein